jgi:peptide/nickel transport system substrate-binding protein
MPPGGPSLGGMPGGGPPPGGMPSLGSASSLASVDIIDDYTIRVNIKEWTNTIPDSFAESMSPYFMVSKAAYDKNSLDWMRQNPVGTGPFKFVSYQKDVDLKMVKNPDYWKKDTQGNTLPYLDGIEFIFMADEITMKNAFQTNMGDEMGLTTLKSANDLAASGLIVKVVGDALDVLIPDTADNDSPWANQKVREAAEYAIDREAIASAFSYGYWKAPYQIPPSSSAAYNPDFSLGRKYDPVKAKQLLTEAGYPEGFKTTIIASSTITKDILIAVQSYFNKVGIQTELNVVEIGKFMTYGGSGTWPNNSLLYNPIPALNANFTSGLNYISNMIGRSWLRTPEWTQAYQVALASPNPDIKMVRAVTDIITRDASMIPLDVTTVGVAKYPYVMIGFGERGTSKFWNAEEAWLNK